MRSFYYTIAFLALVSCGQIEKREFFPTDMSISQVFHIKSDRDTTLIGAKGTIVKLKANSFIANSGLAVNDDIKIEVKEFYTVEDFINNRLSTNTVDGRVLRSSGMLFIEAKSDTNVLKLKHDSPMTIMFKRIQNFKTANLFSGEIGALGEVRWSLLEPVHNDTIVVRREIITSLSYGEERVRVDLLFLIGKDTILLTPKNEGTFKSIIERLSEDRLARRYQDLSIGDSTTSYYPIDKDRFYVFETTNLGYVNCDIFIEDELYPFSVTVDNSDSDIFIILDSLNSVLYPDSISLASNQYIFSVPKNIKISVVAYRKDGDKHYLGIERIKSGSESIFIEQHEKPLDKMKDEVKGISEVVAR